MVLFLLVHNLYLLDYLLVHTIRYYNPYLASPSHMLLLSTLHNLRYVAFLSPSTALFLLSFILLLSFMSLVSALLFLLAYVLLYIHYIIVLVVIHLPSQNLSHLIILLSLSNSILLCLPYVLPLLILLLS